MQEVFRYIYTLKYRPTLTASRNHLLLHLRVAATADKYAMQDLQRLAINGFNFCKTDPAYEESFAEVVREVYENAALERYRVVFLEHVLENLEKYQANKERYVEVWKALEEVPAFAVDLVRGGVESIVDTKKRAADADANGDSPGGRETKKDDEYHARRWWYW